VSNGYVQGYNAQAVVGEGQIVIAAEVTIGPQDFGHLGPTVTAARRELADAGVSEKPDVVLADSGYWHGVQMDTLTGDGIQVSIPPDSSKRDGARPGWTGGRYEWMRHVLASELGAEFYQRRQVMIEPVFGQIKFNRKIDRFLRRGRAAARSEWRLVAATHNLMKLHNHRLATAGPGRPGSARGAANPTDPEPTQRPRGGFIRQAPGVAGKSRESETALLLAGGARPTLTTPPLQFVEKRKPAKFRWWTAQTLAGVQLFS